MFRQVLRSGMVLTYNMYALFIAATTRARACMPWEGQIVNAS